MDPLDQALAQLRLAAKQAVDRKLRKTTVEAPAVSEPPSVQRWWSLFSFRPS